MLIILVILMRMRDNDYDKLDEYFKCRRQSLVLLPDTPIIDSLLPRS